MRTLRKGLVALSALGLSALFVSCAEGEDEAVSTSTSSAAAGGTTSSVASARAAPNACPAEGCRVRITSATREGSEIKLSFEANYTPDAARNHFHVYWDTYSARQVSDNAEPRFGVKQGEWVPTADNPFTTTEAVSVAARQSSTRLCVTAGDRDHNVIDPEAVDCRDVSGLLT